MSGEVTANALFSGPDRGLLENVVLRHDNGVITDISETASPVTVPRSLVLPAFVNAHDHARAPASSFGAASMPLESWILRSALGTPVDPYLTAASALARSARAGCAAIMIHYTRPSGTMPLVEEAKAIARAASDVGIRIAFALAVRDQNPIVYGDEEPVLSGLSKDDRSTIEQMFVRAPMSPKAYVELTDAIASAIAGPKVDVQLGPAGVQWCSKPLLEAVAQNSAETGRRIHMHLLESPRQRQWLDRRFPQGIVRYLDEVGFLSPRLAVAHGVQLQPAECALLAERGVQLVSNPSANLRLRSGIAPIPLVAEKGPAFAIGLDGSGFDDDQDLWREMRLIHLLHGGRELARRFTADQIFDAAIHIGSKVINAPAAQDFVVIDYDALMADCLFDDIDEAEVLLTRMTSAYARGLFVGGREIMRDGRLITVDFEGARRELREQARGDLPRLRRERQLAGSLSAAIRRYYSEW